MSSPYPTLRVGRLWLSFGPLQQTNHESTKGD